MDGRGRRATGGLAAVAATVMIMTTLGTAWPAVADAPVPDDAPGQSRPQQQEATSGQVDAGDQPATAAVQVPTQRLGGTNRYATAAAISRSQFPDGSSTVYLARSDIFADALAAGSLTDGPVLLVKSCDPVPGVVRDEIARLDPTEVVALGGTGAVCDATLEEAAEGRTAGRVQGANRFETAARIADRSFPDGAPTVYLAEAENGADAVVA